MREIFLRRARTPSALRSVPVPVPVEVEAYERCRDRGGHYIWLPEAEIAPTVASRAQIDKPIAAVDGVGWFFAHGAHRSHLLAAPPRGRCMRSGGPWPFPVQLVADRLEVWKYTVSDGHQPN
ncbi:MAG: hypothetical protein ACK5JT_08095 [Hyphomicrobiaceae bacterium]